MTIIGIDPGLSGGIAIVKDRDVLATYEMPIVKFGTKKVLDCQSIKKIFEDWRTLPHGTSIVIERVHAMPKQGVASMFTFGQGFGILQGLSSGLGIPYEFVMPKTWQKVLDGIDKTLGKKRSVVYCKGKYPSFADLTDGESDAICIALSYHNIQN